MAWQMDADGIQQWVPDTGGISPAELGLVQVNPEGHPVQEGSLGINGPSYLWKGPDGYYITPYDGTGKSVAPQKVSAVTDANVPGILSGAATVSQQADVANKAGFNRDVTLAAMMAGAVAAANAGAFGGATANSAPVVEASFTPGFTPGVEQSVGGGLITPEAATKAIADAGGYSVAPGYVSGTGALEAAVGNAAGQSLVPGSLASGAAAASAAPGFMASLPTLQSTLTQSPAPVEEKSFNADGPNTALPPAVPGTGVKDAFDIAKDIGGIAATVAGIGAIADAGNMEQPDPTSDLQAEAKAQDDRIKKGTDAINAAFSSFGDPYYSGVAQTYRNHYQPLVDEQFNEAKRMLPISMARTDNSEFPRQLGNLTRDYQRQLTDIGSQAESFAGNQRSTVENERSNLISQLIAGAGIDTAAASAAQQAKALATPPAFSPLGDLFQKYSGNVLNQKIAQDGKAMNPWLHQQNPLTFGYGGKGRGGSSAVVGG